MSDSWPQGPLVYKFSDENFVVCFSVVIEQFFMRFLFNLYSKQKHLCNKSMTAELWFTYHRRWKVLNIGGWGRRGTKVQNNWGGGGGGASGGGGKHFASCKLIGARPLISDK